MTKTPVKPEKFKRTILLLIFYYEKTILIFDEFLMSDNWEKDEYKALNEFCSNLGVDYEVLAVSFFSKQVAIKLKKN